MVGRWSGPPRGAKALSQPLVRVYVTALLDNANKILLKTVSFALHKGFRFLKSPLPALCYRALQLYLFVNPILSKDSKTKTSRINSRLYLLLILLCLYTPKTIFAVPSLLGIKNF